jgi:hypothetical protein
VNRKDFFQKKTAEIKRNEIINSLNNNTIEVLNEKYLWISKINDNERDRTEGLRKKAEILLGLHIGFASLLLSGFIFNIFPEFNSKFNALFTATILIFTFGSIILGIYYSLKVGGIPRFTNVLDPTLVFEHHQSNESWLKEVIAETLIVYKKNLNTISSNAFRTRLSFDFLIFSIFAVIIAFVVTEICKLIGKEINFVEFIIIGGLLGFFLLFIIRKILTTKPRSYEN